LFGILGVLLADPILAALKVGLIELSRTRAVERGDPPETV
jgi:predicted PurR-regulated permease PerM